MQARKCGDAYKPSFRRKTAAATLNYGTPLPDTQCAPSHLVGLFKHGRRSIQPGADTNRVPHPSAKRRVGPPLPLRLGILRPRRIGGKGWSVHSQLLKNFRVRKTGVRARPCRVLKNSVLLRFERAQLQLRRRRSFILSSRGGLQPDEGSAFRLFQQPVQACILDSEKSADFSR